MERVKPDFREEEYLIIKLMPRYLTILGDPEVSD